MTALMQRLGGILIAPRDVLSRLVTGHPGGFNDLLLLLLLKATALRLPQIGRIGWQSVDTGPVGAALLLLSVLAQAIMLPLIAALGGGLLLRVVAGNSAAAHRTTDIAAMCVVPAVVLQVVVSLLAVPFPAIYQPWLRDAIRWAGGGWLAVLLVLAALLLRRAAGAAPSEGRQA